MISYLTELNICCSAGAAERHGLEIRWFRKDTGVQIPPAALYHFPGEPGHQAFWGFFYNTVPGQLSGSRIRIFPDQFRITV